MNHIKENIIQAFKETNKNGFMLCEIISIINEVADKYNYPTLESEGVVLNPINYEANVGTNNFKLPKKMFQLLYYLMTNKNKIVNRNEILRDVWGTDICVEDRTIDVHIRKIRAVVGKQKIKTIKCVGYGWFETK